MLDRRERTRRPPEYDGFGVVSEGDDGGFRVELQCELDVGMQNRLVTEVDAIEHADARDGTHWVGRERGDVARDLQ